MTLLKKIGKGVKLMTMLSLCYVIGATSGCTGRNNWSSKLLSPYVNPTTITVSHKNKWGYEKRYDEMYINAKDADGVDKITVKISDYSNRVVNNITYNVSGTNVDKSLSTKYKIDGPHKLEIEVTDKNGKVTLMDLERIVGKGQTNGRLALHVVIDPRINPAATQSNEIKNASSPWNPLLIAPFDFACTRGTGQIFLILYITSPELEDYVIHTAAAKMLGNKVYIIKPGDDVATEITKAQNDRKPNEL